MSRIFDRREVLQGLGAALAGVALGANRAFDNLAFGSVTSAPSTPVAVARCASYQSGVRATLATMFDQIGGLKRLVNGKTVSIKLNLTGEPTNRIRGLDPARTHWVHPAVVGATLSLLGDAGARRIRILESSFSTSGSLEEFLTSAGWNPRELANAAPVLEFEDTNYAGPTGRYVRFPVSGGGLLFKSYELNHAYADCDVYMSIAKLKEHSTAGVTLSMKNSFGITPVTIYGDQAGTGEPAKVARGARGPLHAGDRQPAAPAVAENDPKSPRDPGYRVPRVVVDLALARPIQLAVLDGIETMAGGEGPWVKNPRPVHAGLLVAGTNGVNVDAVGTALMGLDPMAERGAAPFEGCDSTLLLAERAGIGTRDLSRIEVVGESVARARVNFRSV